MITYEVFTRSILPFVLSSEGGYANVKNDKGGETYRGITRKNNPTWRGWAIIDKAKPLKWNQIVKEAETAVYEFYWSRFKGLSLHNLKSVKVALAAFDYNVHGGFSLSTLVRIAKEKFSKNVAKELILSWANQQNEETLAAAIIDHRKAYLKGLIAKDPTQKGFEKDWMARLEKMKTYINLKTAGISAGLIILIVAIIFFLMKGAK